jgi:hypothetical protein
MGSAVKGTRMPFGSVIEKNPDWPHTIHSISDCLFATQATIFENVQN